VQNLCYPEFFAELWVWIQHFSRNRGCRDPGIVARWGLRLVESFSCLGESLRRIPLLQSSAHTLGVPASVGPLQEELRPPATGTNGQETMARGHWGRIFTGCPFVRRKKGVSSAASGRRFFGEESSLVIDGLDHAVPSGEEQARRWRPSREPRKPSIAFCGVCPPAPRFLVD